MTDTKVLREAATAIATYRKQMTEGLSQMREAAKVCAENMGSDRLSSEALQRLESCLKKFNEILDKAAKAQKGINDKADQIDSIKL